MIEGKGKDAQEMWGGRGILSKHSQPALRVNEDDGGGATLPDSHQGGSVTERAEEGKEKQSRHRDEARNMEEDRLEGDEEEKEEGQEEGE